MAFAVPLGVTIGLFDACTTNALVAKGGACFQSIDCQEGLVCVPTPGVDGGGTCSDDLSSITKPVEAGGDAPATTDATTDAPADTGTPDTGAPDTGTPDTGTPETSTPDTGTPDTGASDAPAG